MRVILILISIFLTLNAKALDDKDIGLRHSDLVSEKQKTANIDYFAKEAGESEIFQRSFENAPPMISHTVEDMLPITADNNICESCHLPEVAKELEATAVPPSHFVDFRTGKKLETLAFQRFNCVQCHVPQANAKPLVKNSFRAVFRDKEAVHKSNLIDILNQGVE